MKINLIAQTVVALFLLTGARSASAEAKDNLLQNPGLAAAGERTVTKWEFTSSNVRNDPTMVANVDWGTREFEGSKCLSIVARESRRYNLWWLQAVSVTPGATYELTVECNARISGSGGMQIGFYFLGADKQWIGFVRMESQPPFSGQWEKVSGRITVPENASIMGVRLGANFNGMAEMYFKNPMLREVPE